MPDPAVPSEAVKRGLSPAVAALLVIVFLVLGFVGGAYLGPRVGIGGPGQEPAKTTIVVGTNTPFPPMEFRDPSSGKLVGFDVDMMEEIAARNDWTLLWRDFQDWDALLLAIQFEGVDVGASSITMSGSVGSARNASFDFSNPYFEADQAVVVRSASPGVNCAAAECTLDELANHTVAVQSLTTSYYWIDENLVSSARTPASMVSDYGDVSQVIQELVNNQVDWILVDKPAAENIVAGNANLAIAGTIETDELYGFATADGDPNSLIPKINSALAAMRADGKYDEILNRWFGG